jgi:hypothetical protein
MIRGRKDGQSVVLVALAMPVAIILLGFVVDAAHAFVDQKHLQNAADAAALAAAQEVAGGACPSCGTTATQYTKYNGFDLTSVGGTLAQCPVDGQGVADTPSGNGANAENCYQYPYVDVDANGNPHTNSDEVLVRLENCTGTFFGGFVGVSSICESVRSVARATPQTGTIVHPPSTNVFGGTTSYSTTVVTTPGTAGGGVGFAKSTACSAITYLGAGGGTVGSLETNGGFKVGNNGVVQFIAWGGQSGCNQITNGGQVVATSTLPSVPVDWPLQPPSPAPPAGCIPLNPSAQTFTISAKALSGTTATLTTSAANTISTGDSVTVSTGDPRFDGTFTVTGSSSTTFSYTLSGAALAALTSSITNESVSAGTATLTTSAAHHLGAGDTVTVNTGGLALDRSTTVAAVPTPTTFKYTVPSFSTTAWSVDAAGTVATLTTSSAHGLHVGDKISVSGFSGPRAGLDTTAPAGVAAVTGTTISYTLSSASPTLAGKNGAQGGAVSLSTSSSSVSGTVTVTAVGAGSSGTVVDTPSASSVTISAGWKGAHSPGVYCLTAASGTLNIAANGTDFSGYTWFAPSISVSSGNQTFTPASGQSTLFDAYIGSLSLQGNGNTASGNMFAPNGDASISGGSVGAGSGFIESQTLTISGNFASFNGTGPTFDSTTTTTVSTTATPPTTIVTPGSTQTVTTGTTIGLGE